MPDKNYNVDDILREIRSKRPPETAPLPPESTTARGRSYEDEEEVREYTPPAKPAVRSRRSQETPSRALWEEDDEEEPPRPSRTARTQAARPARQETPPRTLWEEDDEEEPPRPSRTARAQAAKPARQEAPSRALWEEDDEEEPPRTSRTARAQAARPTRQEVPSRALWEEDDEEKPPRPSHTAQTRAAKSPRRETPSPALWEEDEEEPPRTSRTAEAKAPKTPRQAACSQALWEAEDEQLPQQSSPAMPRAAKNTRQEIPSLSRWEEEYEPAPAKAAKAPQAPARPLWEDGTPPQSPENSVPQTSRNRSAAAAARLITGGDEEKPKKGRRKRSEGDEEERPRSRRKREEDEEERPRPRRKQEEQEERSRPHIGAQLQGMKTSLIIRLVVNLLCAGGLIYLMLAPGQEFPIPEYFMDHPGHYLWVGVGLLAFSALVSGNTVGGGIISLFCLRPNNDSYSAIGVFACLVQGTYMAMRPEMMTSYAANLYLPMAALLLLFNTIGKLILRGRVAGSYRLIAKEGAKHTAAVIDDHQLAGKIGGDIIDDDPEIAYFTRSAGVLAFLDQAFSESKAEDISKVIAPMTAVAALVMALISYPFHKDVFTSACVFTAALCITAPIAGVITANLPIALTNRRLSRWGATICGYSAVDQFANVNEMLLRGHDLFPPESVTLHTVKPFNRAPLDQVLVDIASVLNQCDSTLTQIFTEMIDRPEQLRETESFVFEDSKGVSAWVEGRRVLIGNRDLMQSYGVAIPPPEYEEQYQGKQILYIANSGQAAAICVLSYKADKQMRRALELLADRDIAVCVYTTDPNVTADRVSQIYNFPRELVKVIPAALHREVDRYLDPQAKARAGMIHNGEPSSYVRGVAAARSCDNTLTVETALLLLSVVVGFALVTFFAFTGGMPALTWITIAVYQAFWAAVQLLVALFKAN